MLISFPMFGIKLMNLEAFDDEGELNVIIETPKGSRNKFNYDEETGLFKLGGVLPSGASFPFDFGFVPSTIGGDGDPLDVLVLLEEPVFPGCRVRCRLVGVIEGEQSNKHETERNDRLLAVAEESQDHKDIRSIKDLNDNLVEEIEHFFVSYHELDGKQFKPLARHGPNRAMKLVRKGVKQSESSRRNGHEEGAPGTNGRARQQA